MNDRSLLWPRRRFLTTTGIMAAGCLSPTLAAERIRPAPDLRPEIFRLLREWTDALVRLQFVEPKKPELDGAFHCPGCNRIHGRGGDSVYPLLTMAKLTGGRKYIEAAKRAAGWMKTVDNGDGSWRNETEPGSWKGITVFAAIALGKSLQKHGNLLETSTRQEWAGRLKLAGAYIRKNFDFNYANVNYPVTASHALALLGRMFDEPDWRMRARELAGQSTGFLTPHGLLYGEGTPITKTSRLGCRPVDLGYNVEESLPSLLEYARLEEDAAVEAAARRAFRGHLEFLLPDGGWDNSWGTRSFKWTYWGSRTSDGCMAALLRLAASDPVYWTAAERQLALFRDCTHDGLLHGGPHLRGSGMLPCVHHTFTHAKGLADAMEHDGTVRRETPPPLPREAARGINYQDEIATWLAASGDWRATVTGYDWFYHQAWHPTGGALSMLWHKAAGPVFAGSLAKYELVEANNMQAARGLDFPLTPRVEEIIDGVTYSSLYDAEAKLETRDSAGELRFTVETRLVNEERQASGSGVQMEYVIGPEDVTVTARRINSTAADRSVLLVLPVISEWNEAVKRTGPGAMIIHKTHATLSVSCSRPFEFAGTPRRVFNLVPGLAAIPITLGTEGNVPVSCRLRV